MSEEFNLQKERAKWFDKWVDKRLSGRCIVELKQIDEEFIKRLKEESKRWMTEKEFGLFNITIEQLSGFEEAEGK